MTNNAKTVTIAPDYKSITIHSPITKTIQIIKQGVQGAKGDKGDSGNGSLGVYVADEDIIAGMPVCVSRTTGHLINARADVYTKSFVAGCLLTSVSAGFTAEVFQNIIDLPDWTLIIGTQYLTPGIIYFLKDTGGLISTNPNDLGYPVRAVVGIATTQTKFNFSIENPILL